LFGHKRATVNDALIQTVLAAVRAGQTIDAALGQREGIAPYPPASLDAVRWAEAMIGCPLPELLRRLYLEVGNGGFGPGYGLLGLDGGATDDLGHNALSNWRHLDVRLRAPRRKTPPRDSQLFPCFYCGCSEYLCLDCRQPDGPMWVFDPGNPRQVFAPRGITFPNLMAGWAGEPDDRAEPDAAPDRRGG
jgi:hypothetical protein